MGRPSEERPITLTIAAYACPVKQEIYRVAERHAGKGVTPSSLPGLTWIDPAIHAVTPLASIFWESSGTTRQHGCAGQARA
ncbi:MAG TPA: hypothetical protein VGL72_06055 [Bryobacteraceae bacterium]|jgi:hypothetical protein